MQDILLDSKLKQWLEEDIGTGDLTSEAIIPEEAVTTGIIHAKETGVACGLSVAGQVFSLMDPRLVFTPLVKDGDVVHNKTLLARVDGPARSVLSGERLALNLLQHLSGIATYTKNWQTLSALTTAGLWITAKQFRACGIWKNMPYALVVVTTTGWDSMMQFSSRTTILRWQGALRRPLPGPKPMPVT